MVHEFQKGGAYTEANYGQYVIIDTIKIEIINQIQKMDFFLEEVLIIIKRIM